MSDPVSAATAKLDRARFLYRELATISRQYLFSLGPFEPKVMSDIEGSAYVVTITLPQPPTVLALVLGDFLNNLRSSLDYVARQLVIAAGNSPIDGGPGSTQFPIHLAAKGVPTTISPGITEGARAILDRIQPYKAEPHAVAKHPLALLSLLNNTDKHQLLNLTALRACDGITSFF